MSKRLMRAASLSLATLRMAVAALTLLGLATIWGVAFFSLRQDDNRNLRAAESETRLLAATFAEHAEATIRLIDTAVTMLARDWVADPENFPRIVGEWNSSLAHLALQIGVADRNGLLVYSNLGVSSPPVSLADREHIRVHLDGTHQGLFVSRPSTASSWSPSIPNTSWPSTRACLWPRQRRSRWCAAPAN